MLLVLLILTLPCSLTKLVAMQRGLGIDGNLKITNVVTEAGLSCCVATTYASAHKNSFAPMPSPIVAFDFEPEAANVTSAATMMGGVQLVMQGSPAPYLNPTGDRKGRSSIVFPSSGTAYAQTLDTPAGLPIGNSPHTISIWFKMNSSGLNDRGTLWFFGAKLAKMSNALRLADMNCARMAHYMWGEDDVTWSTPASICNNTWQHFAFVYDPSASSKTLYLNGLSLGQAPTVGGVNIPEGPVYIGAGMLTELFYGELDDLQMFRTALNASAVLALYRS